MNTSSLPQDLMTNSLLHFENGVPIDDLALRQDQKRRLARVSHVYWQWLSGHRVMYLKEKDGYEPPTGWEEAEEYKE